MPAMQATCEQRAIVASTASPLVVEARAGSGKTSTLRLHACARAHSRVLYVAFNKAIQLEAQAKMPANVQCRTTHSIAYRKAKQLFGDQDRAKVGNTYASSAAKVLGCGALTATGALQTIARWCGSLDESINATHIPPDIALRLADPGALVDGARQLWRHMLDVRVPDIRLPHDGYLKLFQLERPTLRGLDVITVDESQDLNVCTLDIVARQNADLVLVGDPFQNIYSFRASVNALDMICAQERLLLTRSFRFGQGIAALANALLYHFKGASEPIVGAGEPRRSAFSLQIDKPFAVIARTNAVVFEEAVGQLSSGRRFHFVGGTEGYKLEKILDAYYLSIGNRAMVRDPYLRSFQSFEELMRLAEDSDERELKHLARVVASYGDHIPSLIDEIKSRHDEAPRDGWAAFKERFNGIFFMTAHKSKGLEFDQVWLTDDYVTFFEDGKELSVDEIEQEEINVLYVALTRARAALRVCASLAEWLDAHDLWPTITRQGAKP